MLFYARPTSAYCFQLFSENLSWSPDGTNDRLVTENYER